MDADRKKCCFCGLSLDDEVLYGKFYEMSDIQTHYFCLLLSSNMQQHGKDHEGILGFLIEDIRKEVNRGKRLKCSYCLEKGATLGCCKSRCKKVFHLPCGRRNDTLHHFYGHYKSYCSVHRPVQAITTPVLEDSLKSANHCAICFEIMDPWPNINTLWAPCCSVNSWFHRNCIQKLALSAGYFFKCPLCNNKDHFQISMLKQGIFIPEQDASWELVPNAFAELLERYEQCDADMCLSPKGRKYTKCRTRWDIVLCKLCGSQGIHIECGKLKLKRPMWDCSNCISMLQSAKKSSSISDDQSSTISNNINEPQEVSSNSEGRRTSCELNINSPDSGCSSSQRNSSSTKSDADSHLDNIIESCPLGSTRKSIKSNNNKTVSNDDEIQVTAVFSPKFRCTQSRKLLTTCGNTLPLVSHLEHGSIGSIPKSDIITLDEPDIMKKLHHSSEEVITVSDSDDSLDCVIIGHKVLSIDRINEGSSKSLNYKRSNSIKNVKFGDSSLSVEPCSSKSSFYSVNPIANLVQDPEKKHFSLYNTYNTVNICERKKTKPKDKNMLSQKKIVNEKKRSTLFCIDIKNHQEYYFA